MLNLIMVNAKQSNARAKQLRQPNVAIEIKKGLKNSTDVGTGTVKKSHRSSK